MIAAVKVRSSIDARRKAKETMETLNLDKVNKCVLLEDSDSNRGMLEKVKDYIAYGEIDEETVEKLEERTGEDMENFDAVNLTAPSRGYKNTKKNTGQGGSLGERDDMESLLKRMV